MTKQFTVDIDHDNNNFPFHSLADNISEFDIENFTQNLSQSDMDRLNQLKFNPFQQNHNTGIVQPDNNTELDTFCNTSEITCDYLLPDDFKMRSQNFNMQTKFSLIHLNIRSLANKFDSFKNLINTLDTNFQIIGLTDTWLNNNNNDCFTLNEYEFLGSNRTQKRGGGVGLYVSKHLEFKNRNDLDKNIEDTIETKFVEIINNYGKNIIIGVIYRPPNNNFDVFKNAMNENLEKIDRENKLCYLMGDFNLDLFKSESCDYANHFVEQLFTSSFFPLINKATRITHHTATHIDNIFTNNLEQLSDSWNGIIFSDISDHLPIVHVLYTNIKKTSKYVVDATYQRVFNKVNIRTFQEQMKNTSWNSVLNETSDPKKAYKDFLKLFSNVFEANFPFKKKNSVKIDKEKSPWMTNCILKSVRNKNKLYKRFLTKPSITNEKNYKNYKNRLNHIIKVAKKSHYEEQFIKYKQNSRMLWKKINELLNKPKKNTNISKTFVDASSNFIEDPKVIANKFNEYFINIGPNLANKIQCKENDSFEKYLTGSYHSSMFFDPITENELASELKKNEVK